MFLWLNLSKQALSAQFKNDRNSKTKDFNFFS
jgi:hypothetical protein